MADVNLVLQEYYNLLQSIYLAISIFDGLRILSNNHLEYSSFTWLCLLPTARFLPQLYQDHHGQIFK